MTNRNLDRMAEEVERRLAAQFDTLQPANLAEILAASAAAADLALERPGAFLGHMLRGAVIMALALFLAFG